MKLNPTFPFGWFSAGFMLLLLIKLNAATLYVDVNSTKPLPPFANWVNAASNIQQAVDIAVWGDEIVVTNGVYRTGGRMVGSISNRVVLNKAVTLRSVNGPEVTAMATTTGRSGKPARFRPIAFPCCEC